MKLSAKHIILGFVCNLLFAGCFFESVGPGTDTGPLDINGFYYVDNQTEYLLNLEAKIPAPVCFPLPLQEEIVPPDTIVNFHIHNPVMETDVIPSEVFGEFKVFAEIEGTDSLIYEGVWNNHWEIRDDRGGPHFFLTLPR